MVGRLIRATAIVGAAFALGGATGHPESEIETEIVCSVSGYDIAIVNAGEDTVAAGTVLAWLVPFARVAGSHTLTADLEPDTPLYLSAALGSNFLSNDTACAIEIE